MKFFNSILVNLVILAVLLSCSVLAADLANRGNLFLDTRDNENYRLHITEYQEASGENWNDIWKEECFYGDDNLVDEQITLVLEDSEWVPNARRAYTYDDSGNTTELIESSWSNSNWRDMQKTEYTYDEFNQLIESVMMMKINISWQNWDKREYSYDDEGKMTEHIIYFWEDNNWDKDIRDTFFYDENGNNTMKIAQLWNDYAWVDFTRDLITHDEFGNMTKLEYQQYIEDTWTNVGRWLHTFDEDNLGLNMLFQRWEEDAYNDERLETYDYDDEDNRIETISQYLIDGQWVNYWRYLYSWEENTAITNNNSLTSIKRTMSSWNYPNPFNPETTITYTLICNSPVKINIFNAKGQLVKHLEDSTQPRGTHSITWDGSATDGSPCASGFYFYKITAGNQSDTGKMVLSK